MSDATEPVLVFDRVSLAEQPPYDSGLAEVSFTLRAGELGLVEVSAEDSRTPLADLACGILEPEAGRVSYQGVDWRERSPDDAARARGGIGRVFDAGGWISNLDVDENITLAARYHEQRPPAEVRAEAESLARAIGQPELIHTRPTLVSRNELRRSQWVRALLGQPPLLLMERPAHDLPAAWHGPLQEQLDRARARGAAVLWITSELASARARLKPTLSLRLLHTKLQPVS